MRIRFYFKKFSCVFVIFLSINSALVLCQEKTDKPIVGYINDAWFEFPADRYTFVGVIKQENGKQIITDVAWGYKYPSMQPLLHNVKSRGDFMKDWVSTDWIRVGVEYRQPTFTLDGPVHAIKNGKGILGLEKGDHYIVGKNINEFGLYHAYLNDLKKYDGPIGITYGQNVYWYKPEDKVLTFIFCKNHKGAAGAHCDQTTIDHVTGVVVSLDYDGKNLPYWKDIQTKTLNILHTFIKK